MKYANKNTKNQVWMLVVNILLMGLYFLLCFTAKEVEPDPKFPDNFTDWGTYLFILITYIVTTVAMHVWCAIGNKYKSVKILYFFYVILGIICFVSIFVCMGVFVNSGDKTTLDESRCLVAIIGCAMLNSTLGIHLLSSTCRNCYHYRSIAKTGSGTEKIKEYVKGWTSTNTVATAKDIYGNTIATVEENVYHPGYTRTKTEHFNTYQCFVCGQKTRD